MIAKRPSSSPVSERELPHNLEAERAVLGAILVDNSLLPLALGIVTPASFFRAAHSRVFERILEIGARGEPIDLVTLKEELHSAGELDEVGGPAYLASLVDGIPRATNIAHYARIVANRAAARQAIIVVRQMLDELHDEPSSLGDGATTRRLEQLRELARVKSDSLSPALTILSDAALGQIRAGADYVPGVLSSGVNVLAAAPGKGKTTLAISLCIHAVAGLAWLGETICHPGPAVLVAAEGAGALPARVRAGKIGAGLDPDVHLDGLFVVPRAVNLYTRERDYQELLTFIAEKQVRLLVFDTLSVCCVGADENNAADMTAALEAARALGTTILLLHHLDKVGRAERGSSAIRATADSLLTIVDTDDVLTLSVEKLRDGAPSEPMQLKLVQPPGSSACTIQLLRDTSPSSNLSAAQKVVLDALWTTFPNGNATRADWLTLIPTVKERTAYHAIARLSELGYVSESRGRFTPRRRG